MVWKDAAEKVHRMPAQQWVKNVKTQKPLAYPWVFVGSGFWTDETSGDRYYYADGGEFICVSNFASALLDLPVQSSQANDDLLYVAYSENIPPRGTPVQLVLTPKIPPKKPTKPVTDPPSSPPAKTTAEPSKTHGKKPTLPPGSSGPATKKSSKKSTDASSDGTGGSV